MAERRYAVIIFQINDDEDIDYDDVEHIVSELPAGSVPDNWTFEGCDVVEDDLRWQLLKPGFD